MREWTLQYWNDGNRSVENWFDELSMLQFKAVAKELMLLQRCGNQLRLPHSRSLGQGLFELRERQFGYRIYYSFQPGSNIVILQAGDKSTQQSDIRIARIRLATLIKS